MALATYFSNMYNDVQALKKGLTADQVLTFLRLHAHPQMLTNVSGFVLANCSDVCRSSHDLPFTSSGPHYPSNSQ